MANGLIVKALSGYYYVQPEDKAVKPIQCRARGVFKKRDISPLVGDHVVYETTENEEGWIQGVHPRHSELIRPPISNVDKAIIVFSAIEPELQLLQLDKFLVHAEQAGVQAEICITKIDLLQPVQFKQLEADMEIYRRIGYPVLLTSTRQPYGIEALRSRLSGHISVFAGQSGVGKTSLLNALLPEMQLKTSEISRKLGRGKHTTRHVELLPFEKSGYVADTPGFSQLDFFNIEAVDLASYFKEFQHFSPRCKFRGCLHEKEPQCAVIDELSADNIAASRYQSYLQFLHEIQQKKRRY